MEQEGIYYYFKHEDGKHTLVLADSHGAHEAVPGLRASSPSCRRRADTPRQKDDVIEDWSVSKRDPAGRVRRSTTTTSSGPAPSCRSSTSDARKHAEADVRGLRLSRASTSARPKASTSSQTRLESCRRSTSCARAAATRAALCTGRLFKLAEHPRDDQNREYLVTSAQYRLQFERLRVGLDGSGGDYRCSFTAMPSSSAVPAARAARPSRSCRGRRPAVVVGPVRRRDLHRQVRPREGAVPLGPPRQEGREQLLLGARVAPLGGQELGRDRTSRASARR